MLYCTADDVILIFGLSNIAQWADANNNQVQAEIDDRVAWAIESATDELDSYLAETHYPFPIAEGSPVPKLVKRLVAMLTGVMLYNLPRGTTDVDGDGNAVNNLAATEQYVYSTINKIIARQIRITGLTTTATVAPFTVREDNPYPTGSRPEMISTGSQLPATYNPELPDSQS